LACELVGVLEKELVFEGLRRSIPATLDFTPFSYGSFHSRLVTPARHLES
jgi:hypothetical protein